MDVRVSEDAGNPFSSYHPLYLGDAAVELVLSVTGECRGAGACVAGDDGCLCCAVSVEEVGRDCTKELGDLGVLCRCGIG